MRELATLDRSPTLRRSASVLLVLLVASLVLLIAPSPAHAATRTVRRRRGHRVHQRHHPHLRGPTRRRRHADDRGRRHDRHRHHRRRGQVDRPRDRGGRLHGHPRPGDAARGRDAAEPVGQPPHGHGHARAPPAARCSPSGSRPPRAAAAPVPARPPPRVPGETDGETGAPTGSSTEGGFSWSRLAQQTVSGIVFGILLALASVGLSLIYGTTGPEQLRARRAGHARRDPRLHRRADVRPPAAGLRAPRGHRRRAASGWIQDAGIWHPLRRRRVGHHAADDRHDRSVDGAAVHVPVLLRRERAAHRHREPGHRAPSGRSGSR